MNNVISKKTKCLNVKKFSFPQTVKLDLQVKKVSSFSRYRRQDFLKPPIDYKLCKNMIFSKKV